jgi:hypothetical protein
MSKPNDRDREIAEAVARSVSDAIHTPIVLDIFGSAADMVADYREEIESRLAPRPDQRDRAELMSDTIATDAEVMRLKSWLQFIWDIGVDRDGETIAEKLGALVDELVGYAKRGLRGEAIALDSGSLVADEHKPLRPKKSMDAREISALASRITDFYDGEDDFIIAQTRVEELISDLLAPRLNRIPDSRKTIVHENADVHGSVNTPRPKAGGDARENRAIIHDALKLAYELAQDQGRPAMCSHLQMAMESLALLASQGQGDASDAGFNEWFANSETRFAHGQYSDKDIARSAYREGQRAHPQPSGLREAANELLASWDSKFAHCSHDSVVAFMEGSFFRFRAALAQSEREGE